VTTFALVHGAWHGAWCWDPLRPELGRLGHDSVAMDLPVEDGTATFRTYAEVVSGAVDRAEDDLVLVGHSLGAMTIPLVAAERPVRALVFLCGVLPAFGDDPEPEPVSLEPDDDPYRHLHRHTDGSTSWPDAGVVGDAFYSDCPRTVVDWAFARMRPQNSTGLWSAPYPLRGRPACPIVSIACEEDRCIRPAWSTWASRVRLGVEPRWLAGGHSPFASRPRELASFLDALDSEGYPAEA